MPHMSRLIVEISIVCSVRRPRTGVLTRQVQVKILNESLVRRLGIRIWTVSSFRTLGVEVWT